MTYPLNKQPRFSGLFAFGGEENFRPRPMSLIIEENTRFYPIDYYMYFHNTVQFLNTVAKKIQFKLLNYKDI